MWLKTHLAGPLDSSYLRKIWAQIHLHYYYIICRPDQGCFTKPSSYFNFSVLLWVISLSNISTDKRFFTPGSGA